MFFCYGTFFCFYGLPETEVTFMVDDSHFVHVDSNLPRRSDLGSSFTAYRTSFFIKIVRSII